MTRYSYNSKPISQWPPGTPVQLTDIYLATDQADLTQSPSGTTKKYTIQDLSDFLQVNNLSNAVLSTRLGTVSNLNAVYVNGVAGVGATLTNNGALIPLSIDGFVANLDDRILVSFQNNAFENGVYVVTDAGNTIDPWVLTRASDYDNTPDAKISFGDYVAVILGTDNSSSWFFQTLPDVVNVGTDPIDFRRKVFSLIFPWVNQTLPSTTLQVNTGYTSSAGVSLITYTLPVTSPQGSFVTITGKDAGLYTIAQNAGQIIRFGAVSSTLGVGGSVSSQLQYDNITLICIVADTEWTVTSSQGNFTLV